MLYMGPLTISYGPIGYVYHGPNDAGYYLAR